MPSGSESLHRFVLRTRVALTGARRCLGPATAPAGRALAEQSRARVPDPGPTRVSVTYRVGVGMHGTEDRGKDQPVEVAAAATGMMVRNAVRRAPLLGSDGDPLQC